MTRLRSDVPVLFDEVSINNGPDKEQERTTNEKHIDAHATHVLPTRTKNQASFLAPDFVPVFLLGFVLAGAFVDDFARSVFGLDFGAASADALSALD